MDNSRYLTLPKKIAMSAIVGRDDQIMKNIQANSGIASFVVNKKERSILCYGTAESLVHAQKLMNNQFMVKWNTVLYKYLDYPELYPDDILFEDDSIVVTKDAFPKAKCHLLVIVKDRKIVGMFCLSMCIIFILIN